MVGMEIMLLFTIFLLILGVYCDSDTVAKESEEEVPKL